MKLSIFASILAALASSATAADLATSNRAPTPLDGRTAMPAYTVAGRANAVDGRTLYFPQTAQKIRLADIDACELPQWAMDPHWNRKATKAPPPPVPCGPLAKSWLKRTVGAASVSCTIAGYAPDGVPLGRCTTGRLDIALEILRVGWARVATPTPQDQKYLAYQQAAMAARYGMWATYVLDMAEWRKKAVDRTASRQPLADFNLLAERQSEISPPFIDARNKPKRTDR